MGARPWSLQRAVGWLAAMETWGSHQRLTSHSMRKVAEVSTPCLRGPKGAAASWRDLRKAVGWLAAMETWGSHQRLTSHSMRRMTEVSTP